MTPIVAGMLVFGLVLLLTGAEALVRGASKLAARLGMTPLVIGLTVVAFGTSAPELAISVKSSFSGQADIAVGNIVGSNIFNILVILGLSALVAPLVVQRQLVRFDVPLMIGASVLMVLMCADGIVNRAEGLILFAGIVAYTAGMLYFGRRWNGNSGETQETPKGNVAADILMMIAGLAMLVLGSRWLVESSVQIARSLGVSEFVIGATIIAVGTSLPEVAASLVAAFRGQRDIAIGNVVGSNLFNILSVLGATAAVAPEGVTVARHAIDFDLPVMLLIVVLCWPMFYSGFTVNRFEGFVAVLGYLAYTALMILPDDVHLAARLRIALLYGFLPATVAWLAFATLVQARRDGVQLHPRSISVAPRE